MKITEETKDKDLIPEGYELCAEPDQLNCFGFVRVGFNKKQSKTLDDYEYKLILSDTTNVMYHGSKVSYYQILKENNPRQYYSIILQMIADDICEEDVERHHILFDHEDNKDICSILLSINYLGTVKFDTEKHAEQAVEIMGDKLKLLI